MLLKIHKLIINNIITFWKKNNGKLFCCNNDHQEYIDLKNQLNTKLKINVSDDYILTAINYLIQIKLLNEGIALQKVKKVVPSPTGLEQSKKWFLREKNYLWYINAIIGLLGVILGVLLSKLIS